MLRLFARREIDAKDVLGNLILGDVSGTVVQNFNTGTPSQEPSLPWRPLPEDNDLFKLLQWRFRLAPDLIGRGAERAQLLAWAKSDAHPRARFLVGTGGAGKSRLAAEVADQLRREGWTAGFARLDRPALLPVRRHGILLIVDYPEEHREQTRLLLGDLAALADPPAPVRVLLLSRREPDWWVTDIDAAHASDVCDARATAVEPLTHVDVRRLLRAVTKRLATHLKQAPPVWADAAIDAWREREPKLHGLPLFVTAAAVHGVLEPDAALGISGPEVIQALVRREQLRLTNVSRALGLGEHAAARLFALAGAAGGLDADAIRRLAEPALEIGLPPPEEVLDPVHRLPWWQDDGLPAPAPDILAAALLLDVLTKRSDLAPEWLWAALRASGPDLVDRLSRLSYDLGTLHGPGEQRLSGWLAHMIANDVERARQLASVAGAEVPMGVLPLVISVLQTMLAGGVDDNSTRAVWLNDLSNYLSAAGDAPGALQAIQEAVAIYRRLAQANPARFEPNLAGSLNNLPGCLSEAGDAPGALQAIQEAVAIYRRLAQASPARFERDLAGSLNNLSNRLSDAGDAPGALQAIQEAIEVRRRLAQASPARFEPNLARSLNNLSNRLSKAGDNPGASAARREVEDILRRKCNDAGTSNPLSVSSPPMVIAGSWLSL